MNPYYERLLKSLVTHINLCYTRRLFPVANIALAYGPVRTAASRLGRESNNYSSAKAASSCSFFSSSERLKFVEARRSDAKGDLVSIFCEVTPELIFSSRTRYKKWPLRTPLSLATLLGSVGSVSNSIRTSAISLFIFTTDVIEFFF